MENKKEKNINKKEKRRYDRGQVFVKIMAGSLVLIMLLATSATLIISLI